MKVKTTLLFVIVLLAASRCSDISFDQENFQNPELLTTKFENGKGQFSPVERYDKTYLSQNKQAAMLSLACPIWDSQMYICSRSSDVSVISDGEVKGIVENGHWKVILVQHGEYYSVYAGLNEVLVNKGEMVHRNTVIGKLPPIGDGGSPFRFLIYKNRTQLNPSEWIRS